MTQTHHFCQYESALAQLMAAEARGVVGASPPNMSSLWICRWPDGDATLVHAGSKDEAVLILDELGAATAAMLERLPRSRIAWVGFRPCDDPECSDSESDEEGGAHWHAEDCPSEDMLEFLGSAKEALAKAKALAMKREIGLGVAPVLPAAETLDGLVASGVALHDLAQWPADAAPSLAECAEESQADRTDARPCPDRK